MLHPSQAEARGACPAAPVLQELRLVDGEGDWELREIHESAAGGNGSL